MKIELKKLDKLKRTVKVEVSGGEFLKSKQEFYKANSKQLKVPGFRPGSAPQDVLEKHHGKFLREEFLKKSLPLFYKKALEDNKILPISPPYIKDIQLVQDALTFSADFEVKPEIQIKETFYKGIKIKDYMPKVQEIEIEKVLTNLKEGIKKVVNKDFKDRDLAKWASFSDVQSLKDAVKGQLFVEKLRERRQKIDKQVRDHLLKVFKVDLSKVEVERHHEELVARQVYNLRTKGVAQEDIDKYKKDLQEKTKLLAEEEIRLFYILEAIAKNEAIKIDNNLEEVVFGLILSQANYQ